MIKGKVGLFNENYDRVFLQTSQLWFDFNHDENEKSQSFVQLREGIYPYVGFKC